MSNTDVETEVEVLEEKKSGFFSKLLLLWVLPLVYALALGSIILHFAGHSFTSQMTWVYDHTKVLIEKKVEAEKKELEKKKAEKKAESSSENKETDEPSLSTMDASTAAAYLSGLTEDVALKKLKQLQPEIQSAIISELPTDMGNRMIVGLGGEIATETTTISASQLYQNMQPRQIAAILNEIDNNTVVLNQLSQMDPVTASEVISELDPKIAGRIIAQLKP